MVALNISAMAFFAGSASEDVTYDSYNPFNLSQMFSCEDSHLDYIFALLTLPCIISGFLGHAFFAIVIYIHWPVFLTSSTFINFLIFTNALGFLDRAGSAIEYMIQECWNAGDFLCKLSEWIPEYSSTITAGALVLLVGDELHPLIRDRLHRRYRRYIAIVAVLSISFLLTIPEFFMVGVTEMSGDRYCAFEPAHFTLIQLKELCFEYLIPVQIIIAVVLHAKCVNYTKCSGTNQDDERSTRQIEIECACPDRTGTQRRSEAETSTGEPGLITKRGWGSYTATLLFVSFIILKAPHSIITILDAVDNPVPTSIPFLRFRMAMDYIEVTACLFFAAAAPLLVLVSTPIHRKKSKETLQIFKTFLSGRPWHRGFEMDLRSTPSNC